MLQARSIPLHAAANQRDPLAPYRFVFLWLATALATYQIYVLPALGTYFPLSLLLALASVLTVRLREVDRGLAMLFALYAAAIFISGAWSPDFGAWANAIVYGFLFFYGYFVSRSFSDENKLVKILDGFLLLATVNAIMVIVFRFAPGIEDAYFASPFQDIVKNPKLVANLDLFRPNVLDVNKSGGVFDNANTGATFNLICLGAAIATFSTRTRLMSVLYVLLFSAAVFSSGSKSALMIYAAGILATLTVSVLELKNAYLKTIHFCLAGFFISVAFVGPMILQDLSDNVGSTEFGQDVSQTSEYRLLLWRVARLTFAETPLLGLGYGGWAENLWGYAATGVNVNWPAHNSLIQAWSDSGLVAVVLLCTFWVITFWRLLGRVAADKRRTPALGAAFAMGCCAAMSMGDTFPLLGNLNMALPLGVLVAWGLSDRPRRDPAIGPVPAVWQASGEAGVKARNVGIFRLQLFKASEGFIESQAQQLQRYSPVYVGRRRFGAGPSSARVATPRAARASDRALDFLKVSVLRQAGPFLRSLPATPPALIHAHFAIDAVFAQPLAQSLGVPLLTTLHGFDVTRSSWDMLRSGRPSLINGVAWRGHLQRRGDLFLCVSEFIRQAALARGFPADRLRVHYIGIDCSRIEARNHAGDDGLIVHVARLVEKKGTTYLLQALAQIRHRVPKAHLVIIGDGPLRASLESEAQRLGIGDAVRFLGVRPNEDVLRWISRAAVKVVPSVTSSDGDMEGFGIVNLEAGAQGVPVVGFASGGIVEAIEHGYSGYLSTERDVDSLAGHLTRLLLDAPLRQRIGQQARQFIESRFDLRRQTAKLEDVYDELVGA